MNTQDSSPLGWTGWISLQSKGLSRVFSNTTVQKHQFFGTELLTQGNSDSETSWESWEEKGPLFPWGVHGSLITRGSSPPPPSYWNVLPVLPQITGQLCSSLNPRSSSQHWVLDPAGD